MCAGNLYDSIQNLISYRQGNTMHLRYKSQFISDVTKSNGFASDNKMESINMLCGKKIPSS